MDTILLTLPLYRILVILKELLADRLEKRMKLLKFYIKSIKHKLHSFIIFSKQKWIVLASVGFSLYSLALIIQINNINLPNNFINTFVSLIASNPHTIPIFLLLIFISILFMRSTSSVQKSLVAISFTLLLIELSISLDIINLFGKNSFLDDFHAWFLSQPHISEAYFLIIIIILIFAWETFQKNKILFNIIFLTFFILVFFWIVGFYSDEIIAKNLKIFIDFISLYFIDVSFSTIIVNAIMLFLILLLLSWIFKKNKGIMVLPFNTSIDPNSTNNIKSYEGKVISEILIAELNRIYNIHKVHSVISSSPASGRNSTITFLGTAEELSFITESRDPTLISGEPIVESSELTTEDLSGNISGAGTISLAGVTLTIGQILQILKRLCPIGDPGSNLVGSLHAHGSVVYLIARREHLGKRHQLNFSCMCKCESVYNVSVPDLIRELSYKIVKEIHPEIKSKSWIGFKFFTEALDAYDQYLNTGDIEKLEKSRRNCESAIDAEREYTKLFDLFCTLGNAYFELSDFDQSERMFKYAIDLMPFYEVI